MNAATPPYDLRAAARGFARAWNGFFHTPVDARIFAWLRIGWALMVLINAVCWYPDLEKWFAESGVLPSDAVYLLQTRERWSILMWLPGTLQVVQICYWIFIAQILMLLVGAWSRFNAVCVLAWLISFQHRNPIICDSEDIVSRLIGWYVVLMPTNLAWSIDAWRRRPALEKPVMAPAWGLRLLQLQMTAIFLGAAWQKLGGDAWRDGTAMFYVSQLDDYFGRMPTPDWFHETPWIMRGMTWSSIAIELLVPIGIWFRQTRVPMLLLALAFHLSTDLLMHLFLFHWLMLVGWSAFVLPEDFAWLGWIKRKLFAAGSRTPQPSAVTIEQQLQSEPQPQQAVS